MGSDGRNIAKKRCAFPSLLTSVPSPSAKVAVGRTVPPLPWSRFPDGREHYVLEARHKLVHNRGGEPLVEVVFQNDDSVGLGFKRGIQRRSIHQREAEAIALRRGECQRGARQCPRDIRRGSIIAALRLLGPEMTRGRLAVFSASAISAASVSIASERFEVQAHVDPAHSPPRSQAVPGRRVQRDTCEWRCHPDAWRRCWR